MKKKSFDLVKAKAGAKLVTRDERPVKIIYWDVIGATFPIIALIQGEKKEEVATYTVEGKFKTYGNNKEDLFLLEEPTFRLYSNTEELLQDMKKHGPMLKYKYHHFYTNIINVTNEYIRILDYPDMEYSSVNYNELFNDFVWQDGSPCGVEE